MYNKSFCMNFFTDEIYLFLIKYVCSLHSFAYPSLPLSLSLPFFFNPYHSFPLLLSLSPHSLKILFFLITFRFFPLSFSSLFLSIFPYFHLLCLFFPIPPYFFSLPLPFFLFPFFSCFPVTSPHFLPPSPSFYHSLFQFFSSSFPPPPSLLPNFFFSFSSLFLT